MKPERDVDLQSGLDSCPLSVPMSEAMADIRPPGSATIDVAIGTGYAAPTEMSPMFRRLTIALALIAAPSRSWALPGASDPQPRGAAASEARGEATTGPRTIVSSIPTVDHSGWFIGPTIDATTIEGEFELNGGLRGAWLINRRFGIGLAGSALGSDSTADDLDAQGRKIEAGWGGLLLQYIIRSTRVVHGLVDVTIGAGGACVDIEGDGSGECEAARGFFAIEPTANVELNVVSFFRVTVGGGYRWVVGPDKGGLPSSDIGGLVFRTTPAFGEF